MTSAQLQSRLKRLLRPDEVRFDAESLEACARDKWYASHTPDAVVRPRDARGVSRVLAWAHRHGVPVTTRGAGYGYVGGCVPNRGGIVLSVERLNRILEISPADFVAVVQPGVVTATLQEAVEAKGLFYPPDPASRADCSIGGNIATNAGGPRCLKYGVTRDYVLGLDVVLADGTLARLGTRTHKNKTGFDLHRLFVGSEGMLGIITEATLKLLPLPPFRSCLACGFATMRGAVRAIQAIFAAGFLPSAVELADAFTVEAARRRTRSPLLDGSRAFFIVELDGHERSVRREIRTLRDVIRGFGPMRLQEGHGHAGCEAYWALRREFSFSLRDTGLTKMNEDVVVPRGQLEALFRLADSIRRRHRIQVASFGHAGDGNIHVNLMLDPADPSQKRRADKALDDLFKGILRLGGAITGEHGIGLAKKPWWNLAASTEVRALHSRVKDALDPNGILNPGKFLPDPAGRKP